MTDGHVVMRRRSTARFGSARLPPVNAFHVVGALFAIWAVLVAYLGITREGFPRGRREATAVGTVSVLLAMGAIGSAIAVGALEEKEGENREGGKESAAGGGAGKALALTADKSNLKFDKTSLQAKAGKVTISMKNPAAIPHDVSLEGKGRDQKGKVVKGGGTSTVTADLKPGTYTFYCSVDAHRQAGMQGKLTVSG
jgi:plastocyanin